MTQSPHSTPSDPARAVSLARVAHLKDKLRKVRDALLTGLIERDVAIRLALLATVAGEHLLMLGPPGTAKSLVARRLHLAVSGSTYFERLLTRFSVPEELFGPLSIRGLEEDRYERLTEAYLPTASIAFLDEIFKANSAILNALLTLLNEREFDNGTRRERTPLVAVVGASNELPEGEELAALFDRFLLRLHVGPVSKEAFPELLRLRGQASPKVPDALRLTPEDLELARALADTVTVPPDVESLLLELRDWCTAEGMDVSDRRWRKVVKLLQVSALTNGREAVSVWDCWLLQHCLWQDPEDRAKVYTWYAERVGTSHAMDPTRLTRVMVAWEAQLERDKADRSQVRDAKGELLYTDAQGRDTLAPRGPVQKRRDQAPLYLAPAGSTPNSHHHGRAPDRTNGGNGYTVAELNGLYVHISHYAQQFLHWADRATYLADPSNWLVEDQAFAPKMEPTRHKELYIRDCLAQTDTLRNDVVAYQGLLMAHRASMAAEIRDHLWVTADFVDPAQRTLDETAATVSTLLVRADKVRKGFELLPRETPPAQLSRDSGPGAAQPARRQ